MQRPAASLAKFMSICQQTRLASGQGDLPPAYGPLSATVNASYSRPGGASESLKQSQGTLHLSLRACMLPACCYLSICVLLAPGPRTMSCIALVIIALVARLGTGQCPCRPALGGRRWESFRRMNGASTDIQADSTVLRNNVRDNKTVFHRVNARTLFRTEAP